MKFFLVVLCLTIATASALPTQSKRFTVLDLLKDLENVVEEDGKALISKFINVIHHVEDSVLKVKEMVPKVYEKIHQEADEVLAGLKKVTEEIQELLGRKNVYYGFDLLGDLTELSGGTKLATALKLISLADKAHKVMEDAKEFVPHLQATLQKMQTRVENHVSDFATRILKELGLQDVTSQSSVANKIIDLLEKVENEGHYLMLDLLHSMEETFEILREKLPEEYQKVKHSVEEISAKIQELVKEVEKSLVMRSFNLLDIAGNVSEGTSLSTVFKVMSLVDKFNTVVQDVKNFGPRSEMFLQRSVKKVADRAQNFFTHAANNLLE